MREYGSVSIGTKGLGQKRSEGSARQNMADLLPSETAGARAQAHDPVSGKRTAAALCFSSLFVFFFLPRFMARFGRMETLNGSSKFTIKIEARSNITLKNKGNEKAKEPQRNFKCVIEFQPFIIVRT